MFSLKHRNRDKINRYLAQQRNIQPESTYQRNTQPESTQQRNTQQRNTQPESTQQRNTQQRNTQQRNTQQGNILQGNTLAFIHIGKTGGTTINRLLTLNMKEYKEYHCNNVFDNNEKYIIWLRNPISRFCSAFNHSYYGIHCDINKINKFDLNHSLIPNTMNVSKNRSYVFSLHYDSLMKSFTSANHLAESLTSDDTEVRSKAIELMGCSSEHLNKGIGWYLHNGDFIRSNHNKIIFVGRLETMKEDIKKLSAKLNITLNENIYLRENVYVDKSMKYLSPLAVNNIINWYKDTDYAALQQLYEYGWIKKDTLESYYTYDKIL